MDLRLLQEISDLELPIILPTQLLSQRVSLTYQGGLDFHSEDRGNLYFSLVTVAHNYFIVILARLD